MAKTDDGRTTDTKERILMAALRLFAEQGYASTSVAEIAKSVGISAPALYKHFKNKQALFDALMDASMHAYETEMAEQSEAFLANEERRAAFIRATDDEQIQAIQNLFTYTLTNERTNLFRKLMTVEQFNLHPLAQQFNQRYVDGQVAAFEQLMREAMDAGALKPGNPRALAIQYAAPVTLCIGVCDREPERVEQALTVIDEHIRQFNAANRIPQP